MNHKDLISQYVDTGQSIPEYQVIHLSNNDKKTYLRKRLIAALNHNGRLLDYEFNLYPDDVKLDYVNKMLNFGYVLYGYEFEIFPYKFKLDYVMEKFNNNRNLEKYEFYILPDKLKREYVIDRLKWEWYCLKDYEFNFLPVGEKVKYLTDGNDCGQEHFNLYYDTLSGKDKLDYFYEILRLDWDLGNKEKQEYEQLKKIYEP
jgi:hypothetical protein